ncbi:hypothetical protein MTsPCn5_21740 [Croceitalea sp. MTPC5]|uniref:hypothetical protein n=1 Tax=Croceitalea sp. MTPC5 TaxID=3056565 RepID=UPI002B3C9F4A|nr:hypothetical protein MTsPCn5_21740 [Croceitalea sp. MTPC5]
MKTHIKSILIIIVVAIFFTFIYAFPISSLQRNHKGISDNEIYLILILIFFITILTTYIIYITVLKFRDKKEINVKAEEIVKIKKNEIKQFLNELFNSKDYYTYISTSLPTGKNDSNYGIDYIPFMLDNLRLQKKDFKSTSNIFLSVTIFLALIFSAILIYYGNILIKDDSIGLNKSMEIVNTQMPILVNNLKELKDKESIALESEIISKINLLNNNASDLRNDFREKGYEIENIINLERPKTIYDIPTRFPEIDAYLEKSDSIVKLIADEKEKKAISDIITQIRNNKLSLVNERTEIDQLISNYNKLIAQLNIEISDIKSDFNTLKEKNSLAEFFKRLSIGLIIATFFLAILKFSANLYRENYIQMTQTQSLELEIRKLYIAFKNIDNEESRKIVLNSLLDFRKSATVLGNKTINSKSLDLNNLISQLIAALEKKV